MTSNIVLLPLPGHLKFMPSQQGIESYARAVAEHNVSRALAPVGGLGLRDALLRAKDKLSDGEWEGLCRMFQEQDSIVRRAVAEHNIAVKDAEIEAGRAVRLAEALRDLLSRAPGGYECDDFHHSKDDLHGSLDACPPMQRWHAALDDARAALRAHDKEGGDE